MLYCILEAPKFGLFPQYLALKIHYGLIQQDRSSKGGSVQSCLLALYEYRIHKLGTQQRSTPSAHFVCRPECHSLLKLCSLRLMIRGNQALEWVQALAWAEALEPAQALE